MDGATASAKESSGASKIAAAHEEIISRDSKKLKGLLCEMKEGLDAVRSKVQSLTEKVRGNCFPMGNGISYLDAKHLLLLSYCQSIVYYSLLKAKGLSVNNHPVVRNLVETRLFLEKVRPIDKKLQYQVEKLTRAANTAVSQRAEIDGREAEDNTDLLAYKPNPDMIVSKVDQDTQDGKGVYRPPMFAPTSMDDERSSKQRKMDLRKEKEAVRRASHGSFMKEMMNELEGKPEEVRTNGWYENRDLAKGKAKFEERARIEEENFTRVPLSREERKKIKQLKRAGNGLLGLGDFYHDVYGLVPGEEEGTNKNTMDYSNAKKGKKKFSKRKDVRTVDFDAQKLQGYALPGLLQNQRTI